MDKLARLLFVVITTLVSFALLTPQFISKTFASTNSYYIATNGNDSNSGSFSSPFHTFSKALSKVSAGDTVYVKDGTYFEKVSITKSGIAGAPITIAALNNNAIISTPNLDSSAIYIAGDYIDVYGLQVKSSGGIGVDVKGSFVNLGNLTVQNTRSHGINLRGENIRVRNSKLFNNVLENKGDQGKWGSALKVSLGSNHIVLQNNEVYENWGEGIALTRAANVQVLNNKLYDNFSVNLYVDNSYTVKLAGNFVTCKANSGFERDGHRSLGISLGEESYSDWGSKLNHIEIVNNIVAFCQRGVSYYSSEVSDAGLRNSLIANNTLIGSVDYGIYIGDFPQTSGSRVYNNIVQQSAGKTAIFKDKSGIELINNYLMEKIPTGLFQYTPNYTAQSFRLSMNSTAIDKAVLLNEVQTDFEGKMRPVGRQPDLGAIEVSYWEAF
jgi:parallel beta-helix repeat protein